MHCGPRRPGNRSRRLFGAASMVTPADMSTSAQECRCDAGYFNAIIASEKATGTNCEPVPARFKSAPWTC